MRSVYIRSNNWSSSKLRTQEESTTLENVNNSQNTEQRSITTEHFKGGQIISTFIYMYLWRDWWKCKGWKCNFLSCPYLSCSENTSISTEFHLKIEKYRKRMRLD